MNEFLSAGYDDENDAPEMPATIARFKTGVRHAIKTEWRDDEVVEFVCPHCYAVWLEYASAESYPQYCPGCGADLESL